MHKNEEIIALFYSAFQKLDFNTMNDPSLSLHFRTDRFLVLNTSPDLRKFFYGKLFVSADARITGSTDLVASKTCQP